MPSRRDTTDAWGETRKGFDPAGGVRAGHGKLRATGSPTRATPCAQERASGGGVGAEEEGRDGEPRKSPRAPSARPHDLADEGHTTMANLENDRL